MNSVHAKLWIEFADMGWSALTKNEDSGRDDDE